MIDLAATSLFLKLVDEAYRDEIARYGDGIPSSAEGPEAERSRAAVGAMMDLRTRIREKVAAGRDVGDVTLYESGYVNGVAAQRQNDSGDAQWDNR